MRLISGLLMMGNVADLRTYTQHNTLKSMADMNKAAQLNRLKTTVP